MVDFNMKTVTNQIDSTPTGLGQQPPSDSVQGIKFMIKYSDPYVPLQDRKQDRHFPAIDKLSYNNNLVSIEEGYLEF